MFRAHLFHAVQEEDETIPGLVQQIQQPSFAQGAAVPVFSGAVHDPGPKHRLGLEIEPFHQFDAFPGQGSATVHDEQDPGLPPNPRPGPDGMRGLEVEGEGVVQLQFGRVHRPHAAARRHKEERQESADSAEKSPALRQAMELGNSGSSTGMERNRHGRPPRRLGLPGAWQKPVWAV